MGFNSGFKGLKYSFLQFIPSLCQFCFCFSMEKNKNIVNFFCISGLPTSCISSPSYHSGNCMLYLNERSVNNEYACRSSVLLLGVRNFNSFFLLSIAVQKCQDVDTNLRMIFKKKNHVYVVAVTNSTSRDISVSCE